jgi:glycosyltransferase involved in cell wall biosynthesis
MTGRHRAVGKRIPTRSGATRSAPIYVVAATAVVSLLNYMFAVILLWILPSDEYAVVASITALLLVFGTVAGASAPWVLAREVAVSATDPRRRQRALAFASFVTFGQAVVAALVCILIVANYAAWEPTLAACSAAAVIFIASSAVGYLQGIERFNLISFLRICEVVIKVAAGVVLVKLGMGSWGAISGFAFGALIVFSGAVFYMRGDVMSTWRSRHQIWIRRAIMDRRLWASASGIIGIQAGMAVIAGLDLIIASIMLSGSHRLANYQVVQIFGRIPFYIAGSLAVIVFPRLARLGAQRGMTITLSLRVWIRVCGAAAVVVATLPEPILEHIVPARYGSVFVLLPWSALTGLSLGGMNLTTTYWQAVGKCKSAASVLLATCILSSVCDVLALRSGNTLHLAWSAAATSTVGFCLLLVLVKRDWEHSFRGLARQAAIVAVPGIVLLFVRGHLIVWVAVALTAVALPALRSLHVYGLSLATFQRPRILHLAFEDPRSPGCGGGSIRTFEIDRRLARNFRVTVVCTRYRGSKPYVRDGVRYVHIGLPLGQKLGQLSYFLSLPWALVRYPSELVVEDFAAPFSSVAVPWLTSRPVIGVVQWLFAQQKAAEYGLPFHWVERVGLSSHRHLVAVSEDLATELRRRNPRAEISVIQNALSDEAFLARNQPRHNVLYLGRLEIAQKGLDLLMQAFVCVAHQTGHRLIIAGSGPDEARIKALASSLGIRDRVSFVGQVPSSDRFDLLASAEIVAMPSRYETFGMVAAEALAVGTPVVAFDIPCLRSILPPGSGILVPAFDTNAFAEAMVRVLGDDQLKSRLGSFGKETVNHLRWDGMAAIQEKVYSQVLITAG